MTTSTPCSVAGKVDVIYPCHNRLDYTRITFPRVVHECKISKVFNHLYVYDDASTDGTGEFLLEVLEHSGVPHTLYSAAIGNSTYQINRTVELSETKYLYKVDNDILIARGMLQHLFDYMEEHDDWAFTMAKQTDVFPCGIPTADPKWLHRSFIGGVGMFRRSVFDEMGTIKSSKRFFGFTDYQVQAQRKLGVRSVQVDTITTLNLDVCPWWSRKEHYTKTGESRNMFGQVPGPFNNKYYVHHA